MRAVCIGAIIRTVFHGVLHRLARLQAPGAAAMFGVVVDEHVVGHGQDVAVYRHRAGQDHLRGGHREGKRVVGKITKPNFLSRNLGPFLNLCFNNRDS